MKKKPLIDLAAIALWNKIKIELRNIGTEKIKEEIKEKISKPTPAEDISYIKYPDR